MEEEIYTCRSYSVYPFVCLSICADSCPVHDFICFNIGMLYLAHVSPWDHVSCLFIILIRCWLLTTKSNSLCFGISSCMTRSFCLPWLWHIIFDTWVYHHALTQNLIRPWPLTSRSNSKGFDIASCSGYSFCELWHSHNIFDT